MCEKNAMLAAKHILIISKSGMLYALTFPLVIYRDT